jgi:hypothetical protein
VLGVFGGFFVGHYIFSPTYNIFIVMA